MQRPTLQSALLLIALVTACGSSTHNRDGSSNPDLHARDQSVPADGAGPADFSVGDDLATPPDFTPVPDLVRPADLGKPVDIAQPGGCLGGPPCPPGLLCCMQGARAGNCYDPRCLACCM